MIEAVMSRPKKKKLISVVWYSKKYKAELKKLTKELDRALEKFQVQGAVRIDLQLNHVMRAQGDLQQRGDDAERVRSELLRHARNNDASLVGLRHQLADTAQYDGTMRLFGRDDIELIELIEKGPLEQPGQRYKARLRNSGGLVVVRHFSRPDARFRKEVESAKSIWHPHMLNSIGFSRPDPHMAFIVDDGLYTRSFQATSAKIHGPDKMKWIQQVANDTYRALEYLASLGGNVDYVEVDPRWLIADRDLVITKNDKVLLDPSCYKFDRL
ncbi:hypothetical protein K466DRAFT_666468, partial [Polyporus arcularius HHB13444]